MRWLDGITDLMDVIKGHGEGQGSLVCSCAVHEVTKSGLSD